MDDEEIWCYAMKGDLRGIKAMVELEGKDIINTEKDHHAWTALIWATYFGHFSIVQCLVSNGANINDKSNDGLTPLMTISNWSHLPIVQYLVSNGAHINDKANNGTAALMIVSSIGCRPIVEYLLCKGADVDQRKFSSKA